MTDTTTKRPTPEVIEAVARTIDPLAWLAYGDRRHRDLTLTQAAAAIAAYVEHTQQHVEDTLAADLAAILPNHFHEMHIDYADEFPEARRFTAWASGPLYAEGCGATIPEAVAALRRQIDAAGEG